MKQTQIARFTVIVFSLFLLATFALAEVSAQAQYCIVVNRPIIPVTEGSISPVYNVRLSASPAPGENVVVTPVYDASQITVYPASRTLNMYNWNTGMNFSIAAVDDAVVEPSLLTTYLTHYGVSSMVGTPFHGIGDCLNHVVVTVTDNDVPPPPQMCVEVNRLLIDVSEGGVSPVYHVRLTTPPAPGEYITITPVYDTSQLTVYPASRRLSLSDWHTGHNFSIAAVNDTVDETSPVGVYITHDGVSSLSGGHVSACVVHMLINVADDD